MLKKSVAFLIVILLFSNASTAITLAGDEDEAYEYAIEIESELKERGKTVIILDSSMDIEVPNIDIIAYIQAEKGKVFTENPRESRLLSMATIEEIWIIYPELKEMDLIKWSYARFDEYDRVMTNKKKEKPTLEQMKRLEERNITLLDADRLLREYWSYETLLEKSDAEIRESLIDIYLVNLIAAKNLVVGAGQGTATALTHESVASLEKEAMLGPRKGNEEAQLVFNMLYQVDQSYSFTESFKAYSMKGLFAIYQSARSGLITLPGL